MQTLVVIDGNNVIGTGNAAGLKDMMEPRYQIPTGGIKLLIGQIISHKKRGHSIAVCFDRRSSRREMSEEYKKNRGGSSRRYIQAKVSEDLLANSGVSVFSRDDYEADDLVYWVAKSNKDNYDRIIISSGDTDLYQCVDEKIEYESCYNYTFDLRMDIWDTVMIEDYGIVNYPIRFNHYGLYKAVYGDRTDNIKKIDSPRKPTFEYLSKLMAVSGYYVLPSITVIEEILKGREELTEDELNMLITQLRLVLPLPKPDDMDLNVPTDQPFKLASFEGILNMLGLDQMIKSLSEHGVKKRELKPEEIRYLETCRSEKTKFMILSEECPEDYYPSNKPEGIVNEYL